MSPLDAARDGGLPRADYTPEAPGPLQGVRVLDLSRLVAKKEARIDAPFNETVRRAIDLRELAADAIELDVEATVTGEGHLGQSDEEAAVGAVVVGNQLAI